MARLRSLATGLFLLLITLISCNKHHDGMPAPSIPLDSFQVNLNYPLSSIGTTSATPQQYELIISEGSGRIVMDTILYYNAPLLTWLKTKQKLLDVTLVSGTAVSGYGVHAYKAIEQFNAPIGFYAYLIFPDLGLYNLHKITSTTDMVDLSNPDVATSVPLNTPSSYSTSGFEISGYPDTNDLSHAMVLTYADRNGQAITNATNIFYPGKKGFKKYDFALYGQSSDLVNFASNNLYWLDTIPNNLSLPDPSWYTISQTTDTAISTKFNSTKATFYNIQATLGYNQFVLTAPADSNMLYPIAFFRSLNSRLLKNIDLSKMQLNTVYIWNDAEPNYGQYWINHTTIYQAWKTPMESYSTFQHHL